ncbi:MAG TPA: adenosylcobinamide-phosphate synthase CbiB [Azospirillaceae bacterium]|nr:adenosylcobinamide-phosphate synthase CbiB [Azospirillaceae bacterium]
MTHPDNALTLLLALAIDAVAGEPAWLYARLPHPVVLMGWLIGWCDRTLNRANAPALQRRLLGVAAMALLLGVAVGGAWLVSAALALVPGGWIVEAVLASTLIAQKSLYDHVARVAAALKAEGLAGGRKAVAMIVGRNPESLDEAGVARAAIESCAENFSDGVVAPVFWFAVAGLPGLVGYKLVNTADSMVGHRTPRHLAFGWAAARLDDLINLLPARLAGFLIVVAARVTGRRGAAAGRAMLRDARKHRSPNAGWPEAAMAGALGLALAGPRRYGTEVVEDTWMGDGRAEATAADIDAALVLMRVACGGLWLVALGGVYV